MFNAVAIVFLSVATGWSQTSKPPASATPTASPSFISAAERLQDCTVTIRLEQAALDNQSRPTDTIEGDQIAVFTGVCLPDRLVVTPMAYRPSAQVRITMSDGEQCEGVPVVIDEFTGLALLRIDREPPATLTLSDALPHVGEWVVSAAAWGVEKPVISYGIVGGIDRRIAGTHFPPLLLCDLRSTETSSGAPIVSPSSELHGIVVATSRSQERGWTYAIPVRHIRRMLRTLEHRETADQVADDARGTTVDDEQPAQSDRNIESTENRTSPQKNIATENVPAEVQLPYSLQRAENRTEPIIVIPHRRPIVGMVLEDDGNHIVVAYLTPGGPAERAGMIKGDRIVGLEGVVIRSVYQAVLPTFHYQPGDVLNYQVVRGSEKLSVPIQLGGDVALPASSLEMIDTLIDPKLRISGFDELLSQLPESGLEKGGTAAIDSNRPIDSSKAAVERPANQPNNSSDVASLSNASAIAILQRAIENYQTVIAIQNQRLLQEQQQRDEDRKRLELLEKELKALRAEINQRSNDADPRDLNQSDQ